MVVELDPDINIALSRVRQSLIDNKASRQGDSQPKRRQLTWFTKRNLGHDAESFARNYNARQIILEPVQQYANILKNKFANNSRITVLNIGLGEKTATVNIDVKGEATNVLEKGGNTTVKLIRSIDFFTNIGVGSFDIDLLTMDCEGCELQVLESLLENNMINYFKNIQFESHSHVMGFKRNDWQRRYCVIQEYMSRSHRLTFQYKHVWENWRRLDLK
ncbi:uncharacterized protein LOC132759527 [Ruditapes philippinarum]|uniref:uncharacterized protein LOC132759527 n=1 Tax=Ruditapes philippinarum TaxID=129788 RepID=UPI00295AF263|nr:uncharacterized protein LOC132759527 [Ruditapes philippinarum]